MDTAPPFVLLLLISVTRRHPWPARQRLAHRERWARPPAHCVSNQHADNRWSHGLKADLPLPLHATTRVAQCRRPIGMPVYGTRNQSQGATPAPQRSAQQASGPLRLFFPPGTQIRLQRGWVLEYPVPGYSRVPALSHEVLCIIDSLSTLYPELQSIAEYEVMQEVLKYR